MATLDNPGAVDATPVATDASLPNVSGVTTAVPPAGAQSPATTMRQRKRPDVDYTADDESGEDDQGKDKAEVTWGKTPSGVVFRVPQTHSWVTTMLNTFHRSSLTRWTAFSLLSQPLLFFLLRNWPTTRSVLFLIYFAFWRSAYDFGFAWLLRKQSEEKYIIRTLRRWGWLDVNSESGGEEGREWAKWWKNELEMKMGDGYSWEALPDEYNSWLIFRQLVDIVLLNDFVAYSLFAWANLTFPAGQGVLTHIARWVLGWALIVFNLWVKMDAHRVVKDYAWYWGDAFWLMVMQHDLVFDGVYEIAPHPMYSVGYAGYYGLSIVVGSYTVLFVSLAAHAAQFAFLLWFENPHIDRTYGGAKKPIAARIPFDLKAPSSITSHDTVDMATPAATEGETETEAEIVDLPEQQEPPVKIRSPSATISESLPSTRGKRSRAMSTSMHDLTHRFFRKPVVILSRIDPFRATDFALVLLIAYAVFSLVPALPKSVGLAAHFLHAFAWRFFHSYGLGLVLRAQSKTKWLVRHYLKNYPYPNDNDDLLDNGSDGSDADQNVVRRATEEAFQNWQVGYNISLVMTYVSFIGLAWKTYHLPSDWTVSGTMLRHVLGGALIALHLWSAISTVEALGEFGWFYSDFFLIEQVPARLAYHGIYRFLNNPERTLGGAAFLGLALISNSQLVFFLAIFSHLSHWWFLTFVEQPHMKKLYGDRLRKDGGLTKTVKSMAGKRLANKPAIPEIKRYVDEVRDSIEKVEAKITTVVEDLIEQARPRWSEFAADTKNFVMHARQKTHFTRVAKDMSAYDKSQYSINIASSSSASPVPRFHVGQPIRVSWTAPSNHSRKDWIGIYRLGSCKGDLVTRISSMGKWMPIFEEEYEGNEQVTPSQPVSQGDAGIVTFKGKRLPWAPGQYELRYHHDGKHNVMSTIAPIEIYVSKPSDLHNYRAVHDAVLNIVVLALESNVSLVPRSARARAESMHRSPVAGKRSLGSPPAALAPLSPKAAGKVPAPSPPSTAPATQAAFSLETSAAPVDNGLGLEVPSQLSSPTTDLAIELNAELEHQPAPDDPLDEKLQDADDFVIMDELQAKRISGLLKQAFGVDLSTDVVIADANVAALAKRVMGSRHLVDGMQPLVDAE
jgi:phosphatidylethanolamine N-methyltransferase